MRLILSAILALFMSVQSHAADEYPTGTVTIIVPFPAGGVVDIYARLIADKLQATLKKPFVVENRGGATAMIGTAFVAKAAPNGQTLLFTASTHVISVVARKSPLYKPVDDFAPIINVVEYPFYLVGSPKVPAKNLQEFIAYGRANPGKLNFGTLGPGSGGHLLGETFSQLTEIQAVHVPYRGTGQILLALQSGDVAFAFDSVASAKQHVDSGTLTGFGVTADTRYPNVPDVPTLTEQGMKGFVAQLWLGLLAPANTPAPIIKKINEIVNDALKSPEFVGVNDKNGYRSVGGTPESFAAQIKQDLVTWGEAAKRANVSLD